MGRTPRLRIFAGPNGSGKSTLKEQLKPDWLGYYLNADDIQRALTSEGFDLSPYPFTLEMDEIRQFWGGANILPEPERLLLPTIKRQGFFFSRPKPAMEPRP